MARTICSVTKHLDREWNEVWVWAHLSPQVIERLRVTRAAPQKDWPQPYWRGIMIMDSVSESIGSVAAKMARVLVNADQVELDTTWCLWWRGQLMRYDGLQFQLVLP